MKTLQLLAIMLAFLATPAFAKNVSPGIDVHEGDAGVSLTIHLASGDVVLENITWEFYDSILLSQDNRYLAITSGTDVIGSIEFVDLKLSKVVWSESIRDYKVRWVDDSMQYVASLWWGSSFSVLETHVFRNGRVTSTSQYIGTYHNLGDRPPPLSELYRKIGPGNISEVFEGYYNQKANYEQNDYGSNIASPTPLEIRRRLFSLKLLRIPLLSLRKQDLGREIVSEFVAYSSYAIKTILNKYPTSTFECPDYFNEVYRVLDYCYSEGLLPAGDINMYARDLLSLLKIKESTVGWLFK